MKVLGISGSPRKDGNTEILVSNALEVIQSKGIETEFISLVGKEIRPCIACNKCWQNRDRQCSVTTDDANPLLAKIYDAEGLIVGSPVYYGSATPQMMALLHRAGFVSLANGRLLDRKVGGPIVVARRAGQNFTYAQLFYFFTINGMIVPGSTYWNVAFGLGPGDVRNDAEGMATVQNFAENMAWLMQKLY